MAAVWSFLSHFFSSEPAFEYFFPENEDIPCFYTQQCLTESQILLCLGSLSQFVMEKSLDFGCNILMWFCPKSSLLFISLTHCLEHLLSSTNLDHRRCLQENRIATDNVKYQQKNPLPNPTNTPYPTPITNPLSSRYSISHVLKKETKGRSYHILSKNRAQKETRSYVTIFIRKLSSSLQF